VPGKIMDHGQWLVVSGEGKSRDKVQDSGGERHG